MNVIPWARHIKLDIYVLFWLSSIYTMGVPMNVIPWARHTKLDIYVLFWLSSIYTMVVPDECYSMSASY